MFKEYNSEEYTFSMLVSVKGMRYFGEKEKEKKKGKKKNKNKKRPQKQKMTM